MKFETSQDQANEQSICNELRKHLREEIKITPTLPYKYILDRALLLNDDLRAWIEIKVQKANLRMSTLEYYWLGLRKAKEGVNWAKITNRPFFFIVKFDDMGIMFTEITALSLEEYPITWDGWNIPRVKADKELMLNIPVEKFYRINELNERV